MPWIIITLVAFVVIMMMFFAMVLPKVLKMRHISASVLSAELLEEFDKVSAGLANESSLIGVNAGVYESPQGKVQIFYDSNHQFGYISRIQFFKSLMSYDIYVLWADRSMERFFQHGLKRNYVERRGSGEPFIGSGEPMSEEALRALINQLKQLKT